MPARNSRLVDEFEVRLAEAEMVAIHSCLPGSRFKDFRNPTLKSYSLRRRVVPKAWTDREAKPRFVVTDDDV